MKKMKILFMGTPEFAVSSLEILLSAGYNIVGVVTATDKLAGRGQKLKSSEVKEIAKSKGLRVLQPKNLKSVDFVEEIKALSPDICVVVAFRKLPMEVWTIPKYGTFNLHASLLPNYRGAAPIHWAIINGEMQTGVTTFFINHDIDAGAIISQEKVGILPKDNVATLYEKLKRIGAELVLKTVKLIEDGKTNPKRQEIELYKIAPKLNKENSKINWHKTLDDIYNQIRGLSPFPTAWTNLHLSGKTLPIKIYKADKEFAKHHLQIGQLLEDKNQLKIPVKGGFIIIKELQLPSKRKMSGRDFLNGFAVNGEMFVE